MINTSQNRQSKEKPSTARLTFYLCVTVFAVCLSVVAAGWLIVTRTEGGWYNLPWLLLPAGVIGLLSAGLWLVHSDKELKKKRLADLGFEQPGQTEQLHVSAVIQSMFQATTSVTVVASGTIQQDVRCCVAEVTEIVSRSTGSNDHTLYKYYQDYDKRGLQLVYTHTDMNSWSLPESLLALGIRQHNSNL